MKVFAFIWCRICFLNFTVSDGTLACKRSPNQCDIVCLYMVQYMLLQILLCSMGLRLIKGGQNQCEITWCSICYFNFTVFYGALACKRRPESV